MEKKWHKTCGDKIINYTILLNYIIFKKKLFLIDCYENCGSGDPLERLLRTGGGSFTNFKFVFVSAIPWAFATSWRTNILMPE